MNRTALCIKTLLKLYSRDVVNTKELALYLECNERNVREYIKELRTAGYNITSTKGINGGYILDKEEFFPQIRLTSEEINSIEAAMLYLSKKNDFIAKDDFTLAINKILVSSRNKKNEFDEIRIVEKYPLAMDNARLKEIHDIFSEAITNSNKVMVKYAAVNGSKKEYILEPYKCFIYNNYWYVLAWNEMIKNADPIGMYKLNRFEEIKMLDDKFIRLKTFDEKKYINDSSLNINKIHVMIRFKDVNMAIQERIYGDKQQLILESDNSIILDCYMNEFDAITLALSYGENAKVIYPEELVCKMKNKITNMLKQY